MLTDSEKGFLINYILINNNWLRLRSRALYQELERTAQLGHIRWQNMRAFMMFTLKNEINTNPMYGMLDAGDKDKLLHGNKSEAASKLTPAERRLYVKNEAKSAYTDKEDLDIITYMLQDDHYKNIKRSCEELANTMFDNAKTASSVRERFMRRIRRKLDTYPFLNEAQRSVLRGPPRTPPFEPDAETVDHPNKRRKPNRLSKREKAAVAAAREVLAKSRSAGGRKNISVNQSNNERKPNSSTSDDTSRRRSSRAAVSDKRAVDQALLQQRHATPSSGRRAAALAARAAIFCSQAPTQAPDMMASLLNADSSALWTHNPPPISGLYDSSLGLF